MSALLIHRVLTFQALALAQFALAPPAVQAATCIKQDNADNLNLASSWNVLPGAADIAQWDVVVSTANNTVLGADLTWSGIRIANPAGLVTVGAGNTLTIGASGIDLITATQNLVLDCGLTLQGKQSWKAAAGRTLDVAGTFTHAGAMVDFTSFDATATLGTLANDASGLLGPWATTSSGTTLNYVTSASGAISAYAAATADAGNLASVTSATANYSYSAAATPTGNQTGNTLRYTGGATTTALGTNSLTLNGLMNAGSGKLTISGTAGNPGLVTGASGELDIVANTQGIAISAVVSGPGELVYGGPSAGTLELSGANTYGGGTVINGAQLYLPPGSPKQLGSGTITLNNNAYFYWNGGPFTTSSAVIVNASSTIESGDNVGNFNGPVTLNGTLTTKAYQGQNLNGNISGSGGLVQSSGYLTLRGTNTYTGATILSNNIFQVSKPAALYNADISKWTPANITVASGAKLVLNVGGASDFTLAQVATLFANLTTGLSNNGLKAGSALGFDTANAGNNSTTTYTDVITDSSGTGGGAVGVVKIAGPNNGTLVLAGANTYTGPTTWVSAAGWVSTLKAGVASVPGVSGAFGNHSAVVQSNTYNQKLDITGYDTQIGSLSGGGAGQFGSFVTLGSATLTIGSDNTSPPAYIGTISGTGGNLTKIGSGTLTLSGANTYTGTTTVEGGILAVNGTALSDAGKLVITAGKVQSTGIETVDTLYFGSLPQAVGTWGATGSAATFIDDVHFSGTAGVVNVLHLGIGGSAYDTWASTNGLSGSDALADADPDHDGLANAMEFVLGGQPNPLNAGSNSTGLLPQVSRNPAGDLVFTFQRSDVSLGASTLTFQWSTDLTFPPANDVVVPAAGTATINDVQVAITDGSPKDTIVITVPAAKASAGKLFARLNVTIP